MILLSFMDYLYNKFRFRNSSLKITWPMANNLKASFCKVRRFWWCHFLWMPYLFISDGVFVKCHFCMVPLFSNCIMGCLFFGCYYVGIPLSPFLAFKKEERIRLTMFSFFFSILERNALNSGYLAEVAILHNIHMNNEVHCISKLCFIAGIPTHWHSSMWMLCNIATSAS